MAANLIAAGATPTELTNLFLIPSDLLAYVPSADKPKHPAPDPS